MTVNQLDISIKNSKNILLVSHINPDGDTLGSMCAMHSIIKENYKKNDNQVRKLSSTGSTSKRIRGTSTIRDETVLCKEMDPSNVLEAAAGRGMGRGRKSLRWEMLHTFL